MGSEMCIRGGDNFSPVLDVDSIGVIAVQNRITKVSTSSDIVASD